MDFRRNCKRQPNGAGGLNVEGLGRCLVCGAGSVMLYAFRPPEGYQGPPLPGQTGTDGVAFGLCSICETAPELFVTAHLMRQLGVGSRPPEGPGHAEGERN
jgi:hypothetical protein